MERAYQGIDELVSFFRHGCDSLTLAFWSVKEKQHLSEVRGMTDALFLLALFMLIIVAVSFNQHDARRFSLVNIILILSLTLILPFFGYFWRHMFHPLLFSNRNWLNTPLDMSYYIMPRLFFKFTFIYLIVSACALNGLLYGLLRYVNRDTSGD